MKVKELVEALTKQDQEADVLVSMEDDRQPDCTAFYQETTRTVLGVNTFSPYVIIFRA